MELQLNATALTLELLELTQHPNPQGLNDLAEKLGIPKTNLKAKERFMREARSILREMPEKVFPSNLNILNTTNEARQTLLDNCQSELDEITNELEELEPTESELENIHWEDDPNSNDK